jgi:predicted nucleic acid-binding Zn finger protein
MTTPDLARLRRAVHLDVERIDSGVWVVTGGSGSHVVRADECDCADFIMRRAKCKHLLAVALRTSRDPDVIRALRELVPLPSRSQRKSSASDQRRAQP